MAKSLIAGNKPRIMAAPLTTMVESRSSVLVGQVAFWSSPTISPRKIRVLRNGFFMLKFGRRGGNRTPNQRFWRPLLYQLSYTPVRGLSLDDAAEAPFRGLGEVRLNS